MRKEFEFGRHRVVFEDAYIVKIDLRGYVGDEFIALMETADAWMAERPYALMLVPLAYCDGMSAPSRTAVLSLKRTLPRAIATYDGNFAMRVAIDMVVRAGKALGVRHRLLYHGKDETDARCWLENVRPSLAAFAAPGVETRPVV